MFNSITIYGQTLSQSGTDLCTGSVVFQWTPPNGESIHNFSYTWKVNGNTVVNTLNIATKSELCYLYFSPNQHVSNTQYDITVDVLEIAKNISTTYSGNSVYAITGLYTKFDETFLYSTDGITTLDGTVPNYNGVGPFGSSYSWYEYFPQNQTSSGLLNTNLIYTIPNNLPLSDGYHYFYYKHYCFGLNCNPPSGIFSVYVMKDLTIVSDNSNLYPGTKLDLKAFNETKFYNNMDSNFFYNFQWYRNGSLIPGATSRNYTALWPGDYYMTALAISNQTLYTSNTITINCNNVNITNYSNYTFPQGNTNLTNGNYKFSGTIIIPGGANVIIDNTRIIVDACTRVVVDKSNFANVQGGKLTIKNSDISGCGIWNGISIVGSNISATSVQNAYLKLDNTQVRDAAIGTYVSNYGKLEIINNSTFEDNMTHVAIINSPGVQSQIINSKFSYIKNTTSNCSNIPTLTPANQSRMIYLNNSSYIYISNNDFNPYIFGGQSVYNGIESYGCNLNGNPAPLYSIKVNNSRFIGNFKNGVYFNTCVKAIIDGSSNSYNWEGDFNEAIYLDQCSDIQINLQKIKPGTNSQTNITGVYSYQTDKLLFTNNTIQSFDRGLEFYQQAASNNQSKFEHNAFLNNNYGVIIAPEIFPINNNANPNPNAPYYNNQRNILLNCNKFYDCNWGVVGVGNIINQQTGNGNDWDCFFTSNNGGNNYSIKADVAWYDYFNNAPRTIVIYYDYVGYPFNFNNGYSINLDNNNINFNNFRSYITENPKSNMGCRGSFKTDPTPLTFSKSDSIMNNITLYPNPFTDKFIIQGINNKFVHYILYDIIGKEIVEGTTNPINNELPIDATILPSGYYLLKITDLETGKNIQTTKLLKINQ